MLYRIYTFLNKMILNVQFGVWLRTHTMQDFEARMISLGCTSTHTRNSMIFTTPNGLGKIEVTDREVIISGDKMAVATAQVKAAAVRCSLCDTKTPHSYKRHLSELYERNKQ
jgi:hypothetical protein